MVHMIVEQTLASLLERYVYSVLLMLLTHKCQV